MTEYQFITYVKRITKGCVYPQNTCLALLREGFRQIGSGAYKKVFHKEGTNFVVKVFRKRFYWYWDHSTCGIIPQKLKRFWLKNIFVSRRYVIQPLVNGLGGNKHDALDILKEHLGREIHSKYDIWSENSRFHNGKPVIIDYTWVTNRVKFPKYRLPTLI